MIEKDQLTASLEKTIKMICAEQPDVPEPQSLSDIDSFTFLQVILEIENDYDIKVLENLGDFKGDSYEALADFIIQHQVAPPEQAPAK